MFNEPNNDLLRRADLVIQVDKDCATIYAALRRDAHPNLLLQFVTEFAAANTVDKQAAVLNKWKEWNHD